MFGRLAAELPAAGVTLKEPAVAWYDGSDEGATLIAAGFETTLERVAVPDVEVGELPAEPRALTVIHRGDMATIGATWQALERQVEALGLSPYGPCREVYLETPQGDEDAWVTELQQPVR
jgi:effector-binding domain-containing protein